MLGQSRPYCLLYARFRAAALFVSLCLLSMIAVGCGEDPSVAATVEPIYVGTCRADSCSSHGLCSEGERGEPTCTCERGYAGAHCEGCALGYHFDARDRCLPDRSCVREPGLCGDHGLCKEEAGALSCMCDRGYEGARCELCASGFAKDRFGECLPLVFSNGETQIAPSMCTVTTCSGHGHCLDTDAGRACQCDPGYQGIRCEGCAEGYSRREGLCVLASSCALAPCGGCEGFESLQGLPSGKDACVSRDARLQMPDLTVTALDGAGEMNLCAPSSHYGLGTQHVNMESGTSAPSKLTFRAPIKTLNFEYATREFPNGQFFAVEFLADRKPLDSITAARGAMKRAAYRFDPPIVEFAIRSATIKSEKIVIDNLTYEFATCK